MFNFDSIVNVVCSNISAEGNVQFKKIQDEIGGHYWDSGDGCMILSVLVGDHVIAISDEVICEYMLNSGNIEDLIYIDPDKTEIIRSVNIFEPRVIYIIEEKPNELISAWWYNKKDAEDNCKEWDRVVKFKEVLE